MMILLTVNVSKAWAVPGLPSSYYGTVKMDGANVPTGTQVSAFINGVQYAISPSLVYGDDTVYSINVPGDDPATIPIEGGVPGDTVVFQVGNMLADQTAPWVVGGNLELNLTSSMSNPPTPTNTSTSTPTATQTFTPTSTNSPTSTPTFTLTYTPTFTPTSTPTSTPAYTPTYTPTLTRTPIGQHLLIYFPVIFH